MRLSPLQKVSSREIACGLCLVVIFFGLNFGAPRILASPNEMALLDELGSLDEDDDATDDDDDDFSGDTYEPGGSRDGAAIRKARPSGVVVGLGRSEAWMTSALSARLWQGTESMWIVGVGTGNYKTELRNSDYTYDITFRTKGAYGGWRHFVGRSVPLFLQAGGGIAQWVGSVETRGSDTARSSSPIRAEQSYGARGVYGEGAIGFAGYWANGFSLEYILMGLGKTLYATYDLGEMDGPTERALKRGVEFPVWYGLLNVAVGYYF